MFLFRPPVLAALALILAGCSHGRAPIAVVAAPAPVVALETAPPPVSAINRALSPAATVWHLRVALNVAALACRGGSELQIIADYNALLRARKASLSTAQTTLSAQFRGRGGDWQDAQDDAMTRLYNFFSQTQARDAFCRAAADVLARTRTLAAADLDGFAQAALPELDAPFARMTTPRAVPGTVIAAASAAPVFAAAPAPLPSTPRIAVDVAALGE